ncbi:MAG: helix-turn-helix domain-containing protein [Acidimicrobiales bacterium]
MRNDRGVVVRALARNLRRTRVERGLSLSDLARRSDVAKATLSSLESGRGNPTIETIGALADALGVPSGDLLAENDQAVQVVRANERQPVDQEGDYISFLERLVGRAIVEVYELSFPAGGRRESSPHSPGTVEHVLVTRGRMVTGTVEEPVELRVGDFAHFAADQPHVYAAPGMAARAVVLLSYP